MSTLKYLFEKYGYSTDIKFKTNNKFNVPLEKLEVAYYSGMEKGVFYKEKKYSIDL